MLAQKSDWICIWRMYDSELLSELLYNQAGVSMPDYRAALVVKALEIGIITIDPEVIAKYAGSVAVECFGIVGMAAVSMKDGLVKLLKKESLTKGIQVGISDENKITLNFHVVVAYGVSISAVTDNLISNVKYKVEEFTGMSVDKINIYIEGVRVID